MRGPRREIDRHTDRGTHIHTHTHTHTHTHIHTHTQRGRYRKTGKEFVELEHESK